MEVDKNQEKGSIEESDNGKEQGNNESDVDIEPQEQDNHEQKSLPYVAPSI